MDALVAAGIELAIDDFGTGYSNLAAVGSLPARIVKLDQSFVRTVATQRRNQAVVKATVDLAHELGYRVVAEGIEDETTAQEIRRYGCDELQGYFFAYPLEAGELVVYFDRSTACAEG